MAQYAFYFDQSRCMSCNSCTVACKDWNQVEPGPVAWRKQFTYEENGGFFPLSMGCNHCSDPACVKGCALGAVIKDANTGIVYVDRAKCEHLKGCIKACPFGKTLIAEDKQESTDLQTINGWRVAHPMQKCDMCRDRVANGQKPACVASCVGRALDWGTVEYVTSTYPDAVRMNSSEFPYAYVNSTTETQPNFFVRKKVNQPKISDLATGYNG